MRITLAVCSWNEADALNRLIRSALPFPFVAEVVIVNHRSADHTPAVIAELSPLLSEKGIPVQVIYEPRDFSETFMFADLRNLALDAASYDIVLMPDADMMFGPRFERIMMQSYALLKEGWVFEARWKLPVILDSFELSEDGHVRQHGRLWFHNPRGRLFNRALTRYQQIGQNGRYEVARATRTGVYSLTLPPMRSCLVSINVKPAARLEIRKTLTLYMQAIKQGKQRGEWLTAAERDALPRELGHGKLVNQTLVGDIYHGGPLCLKTSLPS